MFQSIPAHPDFLTAAAWSLDPLSPGTEDISIEGGQSIGSATSQIVGSTTYTNLTVIYVLGSRYTSDVNYPTNDQFLSAVENQRINNS